MAGADSDAIQLELLDSMEGIEDPIDPPGLSSSTIVDQLQETGEWVNKADPITRGSLSWRPDLHSTDGTRVLHIHLAEELRSYLRDRLEMAAESGAQVVVALQLQSLYQDDVVTFLGAIDAEIMIIHSDKGNTISEAEHLLTVMSDHSVPVINSIRTDVARKAWAKRSTGTSYEKGRRFEGLLAFLLSQTIDFKVVERNLRSTTDEIDLVLQIQKPSDRCWRLEGSPFILVEAKNWSEPVDQEAVSVFYTKLMTKRQTSRIGFLFSASTFTSAATMQELKFAQNSITIVMINGIQLENWIDSDVPDDCLEELVRHAMLK